MFLFFFFFNDTATTEIYTLSLHDALPIFFFLSAAPSFRSAESFFTVLYQSSTIGIVAVGVGLLMIGGEFDLSAGVITITAGLVNSMVCWYFGMNLWVGALVSLAFCLLIGFL